MSQMEGGSKVATPPAEEVDTCVCSARGISKAHKRLWTAVKNNAVMIDAILMHLGAMPKDPDVMASLLWPTDAPQHDAVAPAESAAAADDSGKANAGEESSDSQQGRTLPRSAANAADKSRNFQSCRYQAQRELVRQISKAEHGTPSPAQQHVNDQPVEEKVQRLDNAAEAPATPMPTQPVAGKLDEQALFANMQLRIALARAKKAAQTTAKTCEPAADGDGGQRKDVQVETSKRLKTATSTDNAENSDENSQADESFEYRRALSENRRLIAARNRRRPDGIAAGPSCPKKRRKAAPTCLEDRSIELSEAEEEEEEEEEDLQPQKSKGPFRHRVYSVGESLAWFNGEFWERVRVVKVDADVRIFVHYLRYKKSHDEWLVLAELDPDMLLPWPTPLLPTRKKILSDEQMAEWLEHGR